MLQFSISMSWTVIGTYLALGSVAGVISGMLGVGGGIVVVPVLLWVFHSRGMVEAVVAHTAVATSLATIVFTSLSAIRAQARRGAIDWGIVRLLAPAILLGSFASGLVAGYIPAAALKTLFGVFLLFVSLQLLLQWSPAPRHGLPHRYIVWTVGIGIGGLSALLGIGGGTMTVPFLYGCNVDLRRAIAASTTLGFPIAVFGALGFILSGWKNPELPRWAVGYVYVPAVVGIGAASVVFAPLGVRLAHSLPVALLRRLFGAFLLFVSVRILLFG
jgi:uncharacterized membrane protein YfcA